MDRYSRQILFAGIGREGQRRLRASSALVVGCGALGSAQVEALARAGVGHLRVVDRDFVEESNLQRQTMFTEADARERLPKSVAAARRVAAINSDVAVEAEVADARHDNIERFVRDRDIVLDGTDNFATRYLVNDACVKHNVPWVYGAAVGSYGVTMTVRPRATPCLRCVFEDVPPAASAETCDTAGVIMPIISVVAAVQISEALKLLVGKTEDLHGALMQFDVWRNEWRRIKLGRPAPECPTCALGRYDTLEAEAREFAAVMCGRDAVQISPATASQIDLAALASRLRAAGEVRANEYLVRLSADGFELTVFKDARAIVRGTDDPATARSLYARYVGS
ncbi:MAG: ThiF family adenylyltransferase [Acidobacteria bacterium]|nr:ThiF family adenylyltransferase [Acidobacteriota bacterium]MCA1641037.1 ThiF family adenylyltransferase [Acidobacteriota bacterium]